MWCLFRRHGPKIWPGEHHLSGGLRKADGSQQKSAHAHSTQKEFMALQIGDTASAFEAQTTEGRIWFRDWLGGSCCVLSSPPKDFTPVCMP